VGFAAFRRTPASRTAIALTRRRSICSLREARASSTVTAGHREEGTATPLGTLGGRAAVEGIGEDGEGSGEREWEDVGAPDGEGVACKESARLRRAPQGSTLLASNSGPVDWESSSTTSTRPPRGAEG